MELLGRIRAVLEEVCAMGDPTSAPPVESASPWRLPPHGCQVFQHPIPFPTDALCKCQVIAREIRFPLPIIRVAGLPLKKECSETFERRPVDGLPVHRGAAELLVSLGVRRKRGNCGSHADVEGAWVFQSSGAVEERCRLPLAWALPPHSKSTGASRLFIRSPSVIAGAVATDHPVRGDPLRNSV